MTVRLHDAADNEEAARSTSPTPRPWEQSGQPDVPLAESLPIERQASPSAEPTRTPVDTAATPPPQPQPVKLPTPAETAIAPPLPQPPPLLPDKPVEPTPPEKIEPKDLATTPAPAPRLQPGRSTEFPTTGPAAGRNAAPDRSAARQCQRSKRRRPTPRLPLCQTTRSVPTTPRQFPKP